MFRCLSPIVFTSGKCIFPVKQYLLVVKTNWLVATSQILSGEMWVIPTQTAHDELDLKQFVVDLPWVRPPLWIRDFASSLTDFLRCHCLTFCLLFFSLFLIHRLFLLVACSFQKPARFLYFFYPFCPFNSKKKTLKNATHLSCKHSLSHIGASWDFINLPQTLLTASSQTP